jgi:hypothetical protein
MMSRLQKVPQKDGASSQELNIAPMPEIVSKSFPLCGVGTRSSENSRLIPILESSSY